MDHTNSPIVYHKTALRVKQTEATRIYIIAAIRTLCYNAAVGNLKKTSDVAWMREALEEAKRAISHEDVPIGALLVYEGNIIGRGHNRKEIDADPTAHAEIIALREASHALGSWRLISATMYCTLEPCPMCAGAMVLARLSRLVYGADDAKMGAAGSIIEILRDSRFNHQVAVTRGVLAEESQDLLTTFFNSLRKK